MTVAMQETGLQSYDPVKIKIKELLERTGREGDKAKSFLDNHIARIIEVIRETPELGPVSIHSAGSVFIAQVSPQIPFVSEISPKTGLTVSFKSPSEIHVEDDITVEYGSDGKKRLIKELLISIPPIVFEDKDYLDFRYFHKRSFYIACIDNALKAAALGLRSHYERFENNALLPVLILSDSNLSTSETVIRIRPIGPALHFQSSKLSWSRNNIRSANGDTNRSQEGSSSFYNSTICGDCSYLAQLERARAQAQSCPAFYESCTLGRIWLTQRAFGSQMIKGGFGACEWSFLTAALLESPNSRGHPVLSSRLDSYSIFRHVLNFLASKDLINDPFTFGSCKHVKLPSGRPTLFDSHNHLNILYKMTAESYGRLRDESQNTVKILTKTSTDIFYLTFIANTSRPLLSYDFIFRISRDTLQRFVTVNDESEPGPKLVRQRMYEALDKGLGDRVSRIALEWSRWQADVTSKNDSICGDLLVGFTINPQNFNRSVDRGPAAEQKEEASEFRQFWGNKAELRRFKDGTVSESLVWDTKSKLLVFQQVVLYILERHLSCQLGTSSSLVGSELSTLLPQTVSHYDSALRRSTLLSTSFTELEQRLRNLDDVPLHVRHISPISAEFRTSSIFMYGDMQQNLIPKKAVEINLQFEGSGRWPDDIVAIQRTKIAFLLKIGDGLQQAKDNPLESDIGIENGKSSLQNNAFIDIKYSSGIIFRLRIHSEREEHLLKQLAESPTKGPRAQDQALVALEVYQRDFVFRPRLTQSIRALSTRLPALSSTIKIVKYWFASHLLWHHFSEELIEVLCISVFTRPYPWKIPGTGQAGFFRVIHLLAQWDWRHKPLVVDLSSDSEDTQQQSRLNHDLIHRNFASLRKMDPEAKRIALFVATSIDAEGIAWTRDRPRKVIAARMTALAKSVDEAICRPDFQVLKVAKFFFSSVSDYDFVIRLKAERSIVPFQSQMRGRSKQAFKNLSEDETPESSSPADDYFDELETTWADVVLLFRNPLQPQTIAGLWLPERVNQNWKVNLTFSSKPLASSENDGAIKVGTNKDAVLHDMARLGADMVAKVERFR